MSRNTRRNGTKGIKIHQTAQYCLAVCHKGWEKPQLSAMQPPLSNFLRKWCCHKSRAKSDRANFLNRNQNINKNVELWTCCWPQLGAANQKSGIVRHTGVALVYQSPIQQRFRNVFFVIYSTWSLWNNNNRRLNDLWWIGCFHWLFLTY